MLKTVYRHYCKSQPRTKKTKKQKIPKPASENRLTSKVYCAVKGKVGELYGVTATFVLFLSV